MSPTVETQKQMAVGQAPMDVAGARDDLECWELYQQEHVARLIETIRLRDGAAVTVRPIQPDDVERLQSFHARLSPDTIAMRYFRAAPTLPTREAVRLTHLDYADRMALVATTGSGAEERIVAVVRYERVTDQEAELAFVVDDRWQGQGISSQLLARLIAYGRERGFETMTAITMATNQRMRAVMLHAGYPVSSRYADGCLTLTLDVRGTPVDGAHGGATGQAA